MDTGTPIVWRDSAKEDFRDVLHYLSRYPTAYVDTWTEDLARKLRLLEAFPEMGRIVPEKEISHFREILIGNYRLLYIYLNNSITIVAIRHQSSQLGKL
jgi:plasmid stabilization system protein ParE